MSLLRPKANVAEEIADQAALKAWQPLDARLWQIEQDLLATKSSVGQVQQTATGMLDTTQRRLDNEVRGMLTRHQEVEDTVKRLVADSRRELRQMIEAFEFRDEFAMAPEDAKYGP